MPYILALDQSFFLFINRLPHMPVSDAVALALSGVGTAGLVWFALSFLLFLREEKRNHWFFLPVIAAGGSSWTLVEIILKPLVARMRPDASMGAIIVGSASGSFSFPSGHATIAWAMAAVLGRKEPRVRAIFYMLAILISLSRIYLGKHFPLDVLSGAVIGWGIGSISNHLSERIAAIRTRR